MELVHLDEVDSTSTYAAALLQQGRQPPFMVTAAVQSAGRGRRGHLWVSPRGNLYATIVLAGRDLAADAHELLPLKAGLIVQQIVASLYGLQLTLKWPNDLLFAGGKVGGLLLEAAVSGGQLQTMMLGLGLNLASAPELGGSYQSACLEQLSGLVLSSEEVAAQLAKRFLPAWAALASQQVLAQYTVRGVAVGHLYHHPEQGLATLLGLGSDGTLRLRPLAKAPAPAPDLVLTTIDHGWQWLHQQQDQHAPLVVADVGNSAVKIAVYAPANADAPALVLRWGVRESEAALSALLQQVRSAVPATGWPLFVVSVRPEAQAQLQRLAVAVGLHAVPLAKRRIRCHGSHYAERDLGHDRLAGIEAWLAHLTPDQRRQPNAFALVVQAGTATTIDAVATDGEHLGGMILPGLKTALASLHQVAELLPLIDDAALTAAALALPLGRDTSSAMLTAVAAMTAGAIERTQRETARQWQRQATGVIISGGFAPLLAPLVGGLLRPHLVLEGARLMALGGLNRKG